MKSTHAYVVCIDFVIKAKGFGIRKRNVKDSMKHSKAIFEYFICLESLDVLAT